MFGFRRQETQESNLGRSGEAVSVALIGEGYRRAHVRRLLGGRAKVEALLASDRRAHMLAEIGPEVVVLDCASEGVNPLLALPKLAEIGGFPRVVALTDGCVAHGLDGGVLASLGADACADIRDPQAVIEAVLPTGTEPPTHRRRTLAAAGAAA